MFTWTLAWAGGPVSYRGTCTVCLSALCPASFLRPVGLGFLAATSLPSLRVCETLSMLGIHGFPLARLARQSVRPG